MAICSQCLKRRAKRRCPALGSDLCPLCCGLLRGKKLRCPPACPHLSRHRPYQEQRTIRKTAPGGADVPRDDRLDWLILNIEALLERIAAARPEFSDRDAVLALEYAREKFEKARPALLVSTEPDRVGDEPGEAVYQAVDHCRYEGPIVLPQPLQVYKKEEKTAGLEQVIRAIKRRTGNRLESRTYLETLAQRFAAGRGEPAPGKRIIPVG